VTNALSAPLHGLPVGPVPLATTPVHCAPHAFVTNGMSSRHLPLFPSGARLAPFRSELHSALRSTPARRQPDRSLVKGQKTRGVPPRRSTKRRWAIHKQPASSLMSSTRNLGALSTAGIAGAPTIGRSGLNTTTAPIRIKSTRRDQCALRSAAQAAGRPCPPLDHARSAPLHARSSRTVKLTVHRICGRLPSAARRRRFAPAAFCQALLSALRSTFPARLCS